MKKLLLLLSFLIVNQFVNAQTFSLNGTIADSTDRLPLPGANVVLYPQHDTLARKVAVSDLDGHFKFSGLEAGEYRLRITYIGYAPREIRSLSLSADRNLGTFYIAPASNVLQDVQVDALKVRVEQLGDTTQYNADAFKTNPDASTEDLLTKMPGVTTDGGTVKVNGEEVKRVLVDGKPFFGDDPNMALKNLPAEVVDKIQVFDQLSDQAQFTGFNDGEGVKTINIVTKPGKNEGTFGKLYAGYGEGDTYLAGGNLNFFKGDRKISILGLSNNINQQNFSNEDLLGVAQSSSAQGRGGSGGRGGGRGGSGGGGAENFLTGAQAGVATTNSIGFNYSDNWGKKTKVTGSYFFNATNRRQQSNLSRDFIVPADSLYFYTENNTSRSANTNHRANLRLEYTIDSLNSIILTPRFSVQDNNSRAQLNGQSLISDNRIDSRTDNYNRANTFGYNFNNNLLYRHRFAKPGRTISVNIGTDLNRRNGESELLSTNAYYFSDDTLSRLDQFANQISDGYTVSSDISYTEPIGKKGQLQFVYSPSYTNGFTNKETYNFDPLTNDYQLLDTALTNKFRNLYFSNRAGASYRYSDKKYTFMLRVDYQHAELSGTQEYPYAFDVQKTFRNVLPRAMFNYRFSTTDNLRIFYRTSTQAPTVSQLQNVVNNSNTLFLRTGNPDLDQSYAHNTMLRYSKTNPEKGSSFFVFLAGSYTQNYIANSTFIATADTLLPEGYLLNRGTQITRPVNLEGNWSLRSFLTYGFPVKPLKSNLNINTGFTFNRIPALINDDRNLANNYTFSQGLTLGSNISENLDFTVSYSGNYTIVQNSLQVQSNNNFFSQNTSLRFNWLPWKGLLFNTSLTHTLYAGLAGGFNQDFLLWNASVGYKFLKDRSLEVKVTAFDILNENNSINRTVSETFIEDIQTNVLNRYLMLVVTYNLRQFKK